MEGENQLKIGQSVQVIFPWREDEIPGESNFFKGKITEIIIRSKHAIYVRINGLKNLVPLDRVSI